MFDERFKTDEIPDALHGICKIHSPVGIVKLVGDDGQPAPNGICEFCYAESQDAKFFSCPTHGINPRRSGKDGCPVESCMGNDPGPTEAEVEREAEALSRIHPGGPPAVKDAVDAPPAGSSIVSDRGAGEGAGSATGSTLGRDTEGRGESDRERKEAPTLVDAQSRPLVKTQFGWRDPFHIEEP